MKVKGESEVAQSCPTLSDPMDCSPPGSSIHGILQARVLEWGAIALKSSQRIKILMLKEKKTNHFGHLSHIKRKLICPHFGHLLQIKRKLICL